MSIKTGDQIGPFEVERPMPSEGGMSKVFLARDREAGRNGNHVIVKISATGDENSVVYQDLLRRETIFLTRLRHPGIVRIFPLPVGRNISYTARALSHPDRPWYYAMEYLACGSLAEHAATIANKMPLLWTIELFYQLVTIVDFMHRQRHAHCDLKPQNILFRTEPNERQLPVPVLVDFGSVAPNFQIEQLTASVRYSPPEVLLSLKRSDLEVRNSGIRADKIDVWGLGVILFELLTGRALFNQRSRDSITTTILRGEIESIRKFRHDAHESLDKLVARMLDRDPDKRPTTGQIIEAIEERIQSVRPPRV